jgi:hypothetical protein
MAHAAIRCPDASSSSECKDGGIFDNVIVMDAGRIVAHGRAQDIFDDERLDAAFGVRFERLVTTRDRLLRPM